MHFHEGLNGLDPAQALAYVEQREGLPDGDLSRIHRQQNLIRSILAQAASQHLVTDPLAVCRPLSAVTGAVGVDSGLTNANLRELAFQLVGLRGNDFTSGAEPARTRLGVRSGILAGLQAGLRYACQCLASDRDRIGKEPVSMSPEIPGADGAQAHQPDEYPGPSGQPPRADGAWSDPGWGAPGYAPGEPAAGQRRPLWTRRPVVIGSVAALALLGGATAAYAASDSGGSAATPIAAGNFAATPSPSPSGSAPTGGPFRRSFGGIGIMGGVAGAIHGQLTVPKAGGGYETVDVQRGSVTAVSGTSITVKSADGFSQQYSVTTSTIVDAQRDGIGSIKVNDQVAIVATVSGSTATAVSITDGTAIGKSRQGFGLGGGVPGGPGMTGAPWSSGGAGAQAPPV